ncbi:uncharacterized protein METZ01_LOCUS255045, partial [marine metagenome]
MRKRIAKNEMWFIQANQRLYLNENIKLNRDSDTVSREG